MLTKEADDIQSGAYATIDTEGTTVVQFFVNKDDAICYNTMLEALGQNLHITETPSNDVDKLCDLLGYAYSVVEPGQVIIPRMETLSNDFDL